MPKIKKINKSYMKRKCCGIEETDALCDKKKPSESRQIDCHEN